MSSFLYLFLPALGGYTLTSLYLLKNPLLLHRRKRVAFHSEHISHRGGEFEVRRTRRRCDRSLSPRAGAETGSNATRRGRKSGAFFFSKLQFPPLILSGMLATEYVSAGRRGVCFLPLYFSTGDHLLSLCCQDAGRGSKAQWRPSHSRFTDVEI